MTEQLRGQPDSSISRVTSGGNTLDSNHQGLFIAGVDNLATDNRAAANTASDFTIPLHNPAGPLLGATWWIQGSNPQANFKPRSRSRGASSMQRVRS